jgi:hypothetical protein
MIWDETAGSRTREPPSYVRRSRRLFPATELPMNLLGTACVSFVFAVTVAARAESGLPAGAVKAGAGVVVERGQVKPPPAGCPRPSRACGASTSDGCVFGDVESGSRYCGYTASLGARVLVALGWAVQLSDDEATWGRAAGDISRVLNAEWQAGKYQGTRSADAFFVRCDRTTMTQEDIDAGRLRCVLGFAPLRPAEFVVLEVIQRTAPSHRSWRLPVGTAPGQPSK